MSLSSLSADGRAVAARGQTNMDSDRMWRWAAFGPALVLMVAMALLPLANLFLTSFYDVAWSNGRASWTPVGFAHYPQLLSDPLLKAGVVNTTLFAIGAVGGQMVLGLLLAVMVSRIDRGRVFFRAVFILPILIPGIVIGAIWKLMLNFDFGLVNQVLALVGIAPSDWLGDPRTALLTVMVVDVWHWTPFCFLLFLAGIESLPTDIFEASRIDGASAWQEFRLVTIPLMIPTILVTFAFRLVIAFKVFDEVYLLTSGGPGTSTEVLSFTLFQRFFTEDRVGYGSAMSVAVIFFVSILLVIALSAGRTARART